MRSQRWKSPLEQAGRLRRITTRWLRGAGLPADLYLPGDTVIVEPRRPIRPGEIVVAELVASPFSATDRAGLRTRREGERTREPDPAGAPSFHAGDRSVAERPIPGVREAIFLHDPGAPVIRFVSPGDPEPGDPPPGGLARSASRQDLKECGRLQRRKGRQDRMGPGAVSLQVPVSDLTVIGVVIGLRRAL